MHVAGKVYGEGVKGITMDVSCIYNDTHTFCSKLKEKKIKYVKLFSGDGNTVLSKKDFEDFITFLSKQDAFVVKIFKAAKFSFLKEITKYFYDEHQHFKNEMNGIKKMFSIYGDQVSKYTTLKTLTYNSKDFVGLQIKYEDGPTTWATFSAKCSYDAADYKFTKNAMFDKFIIQTLESLIILQKHGYAHTDLKQNNIIYCDKEKAFKIIDWEMLKPLSWSKNHQYFANVSHNSPLGLYLYNVPKMLAFNIYNSANLKQYPKVYKSREYKHISSMVNKQLTDAIKDKTHKQLFYKYKNNFDMFAIGMTYLHLLVKNKINTQQYMPFIERLLLLDDNRFRSIEEAYTHFTSNR